MLYLKYILASSSPRRKELLEQIGIKFEVVTCDTDESYNKEAKPEDVVRELSLNKAKAVYHKIKGTLKDYTVIIGADTVVADKGKILGKPVSFDDAVSMLKSLSGHKHTVYTGVTMIYCKNDVKVSTFYEKADVFFRSLGDDEIREYVKSGEPMDKAGAYGIQGKGAVFVEKIEGDYFTIVGLPLTKLYTDLLKNR